jgi:hypothetical protein
LAKSLVEGTRIKDNIPSPGNAMLPLIEKYLYKY